MASIPRALEESAPPATSMATIRNLPVEIIVSILSWLDHADYRACRAAGRLWRVCTPAAYARRVLTAPCPPCPRDLVLAGDGIAISGLFKLGRLKSDSCAWMPFSAVWGGHFDLLVTLHKAGAPGFDRDVMDHAAGAGRLDMVTFLHHNRYEGCTTYAMNRAAAHGHLDVVDFLHRRRREGCTRRAIDYAASGGHVDVVAYLDINRTEGCTVGAVNRAVANGHYAVVAYLLAHRKEGGSPAAMAAAAANGDMDMLRLLVEWRQPSDRRAMDAAAAHGHVGALDYLDHALGLGCTAEGIVAAARAGHFHAVAFLLDRRPGDCIGGMSAAAFDALAAGRLDLAQRMWTAMAASKATPLLPDDQVAPLECAPRTVFTRAAAGGHTNALALLSQHNPQAFAENAVDMMVAATEHGQDSAIRYLWSWFRSCPRERASGNALAGVFADDPPVQRTDLAAGQMSLAKIKEAVVCAGARGHVNTALLVYRLTNVSRDAVQEAGVAAAANGHLDVIRAVARQGAWFDRGYGDAAERAAAAGHVCVLDELLLLAPSSSSIGERRDVHVQIIMTGAINGAAGAGRCDILEWVAMRDGDHAATWRCSVAVTRALAGGHVDALRLLRDPAFGRRTGYHTIDPDGRPPAPQTYAWDVAARGGHLAAIAYMCQQGVFPISVSAMTDEAIDGNHIDIVRFAYYKLHSFDPQRAVDRAARRGRHGIRLWLDDALAWGVPRPVCQQQSTTTAKPFDGASLVVMWCKRPMGKTAMLRDLLMKMHRDGYDAFATAADGAYTGHSANRGAPHNTDDNRGENGDTLTLRMGRRD